MKHYSKEETDEILSRFPISLDNKKATNDLLEMFPEFKNSEFYGQTDDELPYLVFSDFNRFIKNYLKNNPDVKSDLLMKRVAEFISILFSSGREDLKDLVFVGIFEDLAEDPNTKALIYLMSAGAGQAFKEFFK